MTPKFKKQDVVLSDGDLGVIKDIVPVIHLDTYQYKIDLGQGKSVFAFEKDIVLYRSA